MNSNTEIKLLGVWGDSPSDVFAVGNEGGIIHFDGNAWSSMNSGTASMLMGIWGSSSSDVFAVGVRYDGSGNDGIVHYDGHTWSDMTDDMEIIYIMNGVWGSSGSDVFAVGRAGVLLHYPGY